MKLRTMDSAGISRWKQGDTVSADKSAACAGGRRYKAHWCAMLADKVRHAMKFADRDTSEIWKRLGSFVETPRPRSMGIKFSDVYISDEGDKYTPSPPHPANCFYVYLPYRLYFGEDEFLNATCASVYESDLWEAHMHIAALKKYHKTTFWGSRGAF